MGKDVKVFIGIIGVSLALALGFALWQGSGQPEAGGGEVASSITLTNISQLEAQPVNYDLGSVPINGGIVTKEYELKNNSEGTVKVGNIVTSCMCTEASITVGDRQSKFFGMEHPGDRNPPLGYEINPGESAKVIVNLDPAAHGPQGTGPFDRVVTISFTQPLGVKQ